MRLVLFDIDGTLILTGGAGMRAFYAALNQVFQLPVNSEVIRPDGKTDPLIAKEFLAHFGKEDLWNEKSRDVLFDSYLKHLKTEMDDARERGVIRILPGVRELLDALAAAHGCALGLVTGNLEQGAHLKLTRAGLSDHFRFGGYGSDSEDRTTLIRIGIRRGIEWIAPEVAEAAIVIGDTPLDIIHGRAAGACVIAVASARYSVAELHAHNPDLAVPDLTAVDDIVSFINGRHGPALRLGQ